jgi:hypothetical protein
MLEKQRLEGPTLAEWAAATLTPDVASSLKDAVTVRPDGSVSIDLTAPATALAAIGRFLNRIGAQVYAEPVQVDVDDVYDQLEDVIRWVADADRPVEINVDGEIVHVTPGPAPREKVDVLALASQRRRRALT